MFDDPDTTGAAAAAEAEPGTGQEDPSPPAEEQDAAAEEDAAWNEVLAEARGEEPPAPKDESGEEDPEEPAGEAGAEGEDPEEPAAAAGAEGDEPAEGEEGAEAAAGAAADADADPDAEIDWGQVDPKVKAAFDAQAARATRAEHAFKSREGREAALQRKLDAVIAGDGGEKKPAEGEEPADQPSAEATAAAEEFQKEWKDFASNYPEIAEPVGKVIGFQNQRIAALSKESADLKQENERLKVGMQQVGEDRQAAAADVAEAQVLEAHPDVDDIAGTDDFKEWVDTQPEFIRAAAEANSKVLVDASAVNRILDMYKADKGIVANGGRNGASTAEPEPGADTKNGAEPEPGAQKPAASPRRRIQRASASAPAPSPGAPAREDDPTLGETEDDVWAEIITADKRQKRAAEARA